MSYFKYLRKNSGRQGGMYLTLKNSFLLVLPLGFEPSL